MATAMIQTSAEEALARNFAALPEDDPTYAARAAAFEYIRERGLPHRRLEDWKYTDLRALMREAPTPAVPSPLAAAQAGMAHADVFRSLDHARVTFVNGHFMPSLSDVRDIDDQVEFASFGRFLAAGGRALETDDDHSPIAAINSAFVHDGAVLTVKAGAALTRPLEILTVFAGETAGLQTLRHRIRVESGAKATILESYAGPERLNYHTNVVADIEVEDNGELVWVKAQEEGDQALHLWLANAKMGAGATFDPFTFSSGAAVARSELRLLLGGEGGRSGIRGVTLAGGRQHIDFTLFVDHAVPNCESREFFRSAVDDEARGVFQGKIIVRAGAQKTEGRMMSQALLLSEKAEFDNKPELEIFADDVVCAHGATCGQIDEDILFFLRSRGIGEDEARRLLIQAFLAEAVEEIGDDAIISALESRTRLKLGLAAGEA